MLKPVDRWQARKEGDRDMRAGLIPSRALQERRILHERANTKTSKEGQFPTNSTGQRCSLSPVHTDILCVAGAANIMKNMPFSLLIPLMQQLQLDTSS